MRKNLIAAILISAALWQSPAMAAPHVLTWEIDTATVPANVCMDFTSTSCLSIGTMSSGGVFTPQLSTPGPIGLVTPNTGAFTTLSATGAVRITGTQTTLSTTALLNSAAGLALGPRGPLFIWSNCASPVAGENCGLQAWVGDNPTGTPGAGHPVTATFTITNGNNRAGLLEALNLNGVICGVAEGCTAGLGYGDVSLQTLEIDVANSADVAFAPRNRAFNATTGNFYKGGLTINSSPAVGKLTNAMFIWSTTSNGNGWFHTGIEISRVYDFGIGCIVDPNGPTVDTGTAFGDACIRDNSKSASFARFGNFTHSGALIDASESAAAGGGFVGFYKGSATAAANLLLFNSANFAMTLAIDSGTSAAQESSLAFNDRGANKWKLIKSSANTLAVLNITTGLSSILVNTNDTVAFASGITVGSTTLISTSVALANDAAASAATLTNSPVAGNPTKWIRVSDNGNLGVIPFWDLP